MSAFESPLQVDLDPEAECEFNYYDYFPDAKYVDEFDDPADHDPDYVPTREEEEAMEAWEIRRRERLAEQQEY